MSEDELTTYERSIRLAQILGVTAKQAVEYAVARVLRDCATRGHDDD